MSGYTPVFSSIYSGTLYGKWPTAAVWASLLPLFDKNGHLDFSIEALCGMTGWPRELLEKGIAQLMEPDPYSRTQDAHEGRRLALIDPRRPWGWKAVNHEKYRQKARQQANSAAQVADGRNAEKIRRHRNRVKPRETSETLSDSNANTNTNRDKREAARIRALTVSGLDQEAFRRWEGYRRETNKPLSASSIEASAKSLAQYGSLQAAVVEQSIANGWRGLFPLKNQSGTPEPIRTWTPPDED